MSKQIYPRLADEETKKVITVNLSNSNQLIATAFQKQNIDVFKFSPCESSMLNFSLKHWHKLSQQCSATLDKNHFCSKNDLLVWTVGQTKHIP